MQISDFGLTGVPSGNPTDKTGFSISRLTNLEIFCFSQYTSVSAGTVKNNERFMIRRQLGFGNEKITNISLIHFSKLRKLKKLCICFRSKVILMKMDCLAHILTILKHLMVDPQTLKEIYWGRGKTSFARHSVTGG